MKSIQKRREPRALTAYRAQPDVRYDGDASFTPVKEQTRQQLVTEQGYLCAYCMSRIYPTHDQMKIEHWHCQEQHPNEQLNYNNMLGSCLGNEGQPPKLQTCDTRKGNAALKYNPANPQHHIDSQVKYQRGKITSDDVEFDIQLNQVLNLNHPRLIQNRNNVTLAISRWFGNKTGSRTVGQLQKELNEWLLPDSNGALREYCGVAIYLLNKRLNRTS